MNDYRKTIQPDDPSPYDPIKVNPIEHDKKEREEKFQDLPKSPSKPMGFAIMTTLIKQFINFFTSKEKGKLLFIDQHQMIEDIASFKKLLQILSQDDQSHNPEFVQQLSELWHNLEEDCNSILSYSREAPKYFTGLKKFLNSLQTFPPKEDHTLGYYLKESVGKEWIPFPFMNMLQALHKESLEDPERCTLAQWISVLDTILGETKSPY
jgi:hypothetical protein